MMFDMYFLSATSRGWVNLSLMVILSFLCKDKGETKSYCFYFHFHSEEMLRPRLIYLFFYCERYTKIRFIFFSYNWISKSKALLTSQGIQKIFSRLLYITTKTNILNNSFFWLVCWVADTFIKLWRPKGTFTLDPHKDFNKVYYNSLGVSQ